VDRRASRVVPIPHNPSDARDDRPAVWVRQEVDLDFDPLADLILLFSLKKDAADAEIYDLTGVPIQLGDGADTCGPFHAVATCAPSLQTFHTSRQSKKRAA